MARRRNSLPELKFHTPSKQHCVYVNGNRVNLGRDKREAEANYRRVVRELLANAGPAPVPPADDPAATVAEVLVAFHAHAATKKDAKYLMRLDYAMLAVADAVLQETGEPVGSIPAARFRGRALLAVRDQLVRRHTHPIARGDGRPAKPLSRKYINGLISTIRAAFTWAAAMDLIPGDNIHNLRAVKVLGDGEGGRETVHVMPVDDATVEATLPFCSRQVAAMIVVQRNSGCRPQDVCRMKRGHISTTADERLHVPGTKPTFRVCAMTVPDTAGRPVSVWLYVPPKHKTTHKGKPLVKVLGPPAQEALRPFLDRGPDEYLFSPREAEAERDAAMRAARKSKVQPSQKCRKKRRPLRVPGECYDTASYRRAISYAVRRANRARRKADPNAEQIEDWAPNQLRHAAATEATEAFDQSHAAALLGHAGMDMIATYVKQAIRKAARVVAEPPPEKRAG